MTDRSSPAGHEQAERLRAQSECAHHDRTGGNDYLLCNDCGLMWDYRREKSHDALIRNLLQALLKVLPPVEPPQEELEQAARHGLQSLADDAQATRSDLLFWMAQRLELDGYKALPCNTCGRESLISVHVLWEELRRAAEGLRSLRDVVDGAIAKAEAAPVAPEPPQNEFVAKVRRLAYWEPGDDVQALRSRLACIGAAAVDALDASALSQPDAGYREKVRPYLKHKLSCPQAYDERGISIIHVEQHLDDDAMENCHHPACRAWCRSSEPECSCGLTSLIHGDSK